MQEININVYFFRKCKLILRTCFGVDVMIIPEHRLSLLRLYHRVAIVTMMRHVRDITLLIFIELDRCIK